MRNENPVLGGAADAAWVERVEIELVGLASDGAFYRPLIVHRDLLRQDLPKDSTVSKLFSVYCKRWSVLYRPLIGHRDLMRRDLSKDYSIKTVSGREVYMFAHFSSSGFVPSPMESKRSRGSVEACCVVSRF